MRDIRADLRERLKAIETEREQLKGRLTDLGVQENTLRQILVIEDARWSRSQPTLFARKNGESATSPIRAFLLEALSDGQEWSLKRLKKHVIEKEFALDTSRPGAALHGALVAMKRAGLVEQVKTGVWKIAKNDAALSPNGQEPEGRIVGRFRVIDGGLAQ